MTIEPAHLIASADEIDNRLGPIPGRSSDRIARELRLAAQEIERLTTQLEASENWIKRYENSVTLG